MPLRITFRKTGKEIRQAVRNRISQLEQRLQRRNQSLDLFLQDTKKVRSYLVRGAGGDIGHGNALFSKDEISSEERDEITQLCRRIRAIEHEVIQLTVVATHLADDQTFDLSFDE